jgi:DNA-binding Xre family transcriptional regulator
VAFRWKVKEVAQKRGITGAPQLAVRAEIAPGTATALWYGRPTRIDMPTMSRLCRVLECTFADLVEYVPGADDEVVDASPTREETPTPVAA